MRFLSRNGTAELLGTPVSDGNRRGDDRADRGTRFAERIHARLIKPEAAYFDETTRSPGQRVDPYTRRKELLGQSNLPIGQ